MHCNFQRNVDSMARDTIRYGSYKGKGPLHLAGSHRPVALESDLMRSYSGVGHTRLNYTLELSGALTLDLFAYRIAISATMMVLTTRASVLRAMELSGVCADAEWDESDAYLRNQREDDEDLLRLLPGVWNFGTWCDAFYSRQRIHPVTDEGLAPCYSPGEGREQGDSFAREGFQALQCVLNTCMPAGATLSIPDVLRPGHSLPMEHQAYSDDRRFQSATMERVVALVTRCMDVSTAAGRVVHPAKLAFHYVRLDATGPHLVERGRPDDDLGDAKGAAGATLGRTPADGGPGAVPSSAPAGLGSGYATPAATFAAATGHASVRDLQRRQPTAWPPGARS